MPTELPSDTLLDALLCNSDEAIVGFRLDGTIVLWSASAEHLYGCAESEVIGKPFSQFLLLDELPGFHKHLRNPHLAETGSLEVTSRKDRSGKRVPVQIKRSLIRDTKGEICGILERASLLTVPSVPHLAEAHLRLLVDQLPVMSWTIDHRLRITSHWGLGFRRRSVAEPVAVGRHITEFFRCAQLEQSPIKQHMDALQGIASRFEFKRRNRVFDVTLEPFRDPQGAILGCLRLAVDITERKKSEEGIRYQATHDALTGLANYREFIDSLEREVLRSARTPSLFALLLFDLDDLKGINDRLGHMAGNFALKHVARVLRENCRASDLPSRFGGDEFAVLLLGSDAAMAEQIAARIRTWLREKPHQPPLSLSFGFSTYPQDGRSAQELFEIADKRLYTNKKAARLRVVSPARGVALGHPRSS